MSKRKVFQSVLLVLSAVLAAMQSVGTNPFDDHYE